MQIAGEPSSTLPESGIRSTEKPIHNAGAQARPSPFPRVIYQPAISLAHSPGYRPPDRCERLSKRSSLLLLSLTVSSDAPRGC
jgi:hypothetical protein